MTSNPESQPPPSETFIEAPTLDIIHIPHTNAVIDTETGKATEYRKIWSKSSANEFRRLAQGIRDIPGTNTFHFIPYSQVPTGRITTYTQFCCSIRPQKTEQERTRITVGGDRINYEGDVSTRTADLTTSKCLWNSVLAKRKQGCDACYACYGISNFYLNTPMEKPEYMRFKIEDIPEEIFKQYKLEALVHNGFVYVEITKGMHGLPQAGRLTNDLLAKRLAKHGYFQSPTTAGLWKYTSQLIQFTLIVDDFGLKYVGKEHALHLLDAIW
jgi:hypothetical protein